MRRLIAPFALVDTLAVAGPAAGFFRRRRRSSVLTRSRATASVCIAAVLTFCIAALGARCCVAQAITDDFNDGNDDGWTHFDPIGIGTFEFPSGGYQIASPASPDPGTVGPARVGSYREDLPCEDFFVAVDLVDWDHVEQVFGLIARSGNYDPLIPFPTGYVLVYGPIQSDGGQDLDLARVDGTSTDTLATATVDDFPLDPGKDYRFTFSGVGDTFTAQVFDLADPLNPLPGYTLTASDSTYTSGFSGLVAASQVDFTYESSASATFDNFVARNLTTLTWDKATATEGDWTDSNWLTPPPSYPDNTVIAIVENDGVASTNFNLVNVTGDEAAHILRLLTPGPTLDTGNYVWLRRTTGWDGGLNEPDDTFGSLTITHELDGAEDHNYVVMDQGTSLSTGTLAGAISRLYYFGSEVHPGPDNQTEEDPYAPGGLNADNVIIPIEDVVLTTPADLTILREFNDQSGDPGGVSRRFVKRGAGTLSVDSTAAVMSAANTVFRIEEGTISVRGDDPLGGAQKVEFAGGSLELTGVLAPPSGAGGEVAYYSFDDPDNPARDDTLLGGDGTVEGGATWVMDPAAGGVMEFTGGADGYIRAPITPLPGNDFTVAFWARRASELKRAGNDGLFQIQLGEAISGTKIIAGWVEGDDEVWGRVIQADGTTLSLPRDNQGFLIDDEWTHLAYRGNGSTYEVFMDGSKTDMPSVAYDGTVSAHDTIIIGRQGTESWGGQLDDFRIYGSALTDEQIAAMADRPQAPLDMSDVDLVVSADSGLKVTSPGTVPFGSLTLQEGILTIEGTSDLVAFSVVAPNTTGTVIPAGLTPGTVVGFGLYTDVDFNGIDVNGNAVTIAKEGPVDWIPQPGDLVDIDADATIEARGGLVVLEGLAPVGDAALAANGGTLAITSLGGDLAVPNPVSAPGDGTVAAGQFGAGVAGTPEEPITVTLSNLGTADGTLRLQTANDYKLNIPSTVATTGGLDVAGDVTTADTVNVGTLSVSAGTLNAGAAVTATDLTVSGGTFNPAAGATVDNASVTGGAVNLGGNLNVLQTMEIRAGSTVNTDASQVVVSGNLQVDSYTYSTDATFAATGDNLATARTLTVDSGTLTITAPPSPPADPVGNWKFDETSGTTASNSAAPGTNTGTLEGDPTWVAGKIGGALAFDGAGDYVNVAQDDRLPIYNNGIGNAFTVAMWVKGGPQPDYRVFSEGSTTTNTPLFNMGTQNAGTTGQYDAYIRPESGSTFGHVWSQAEPFDDTWHHIAWVDDNGAATLYVDGQPDGADFNYTRGTMPSLNTTTIGGILRANPSHFFEGLIDDVWIFDRALTQAEVSALVAKAGTAAGTTVVATGTATLDLAIPADAMLGGLVVQNNATLTLTGATDVAAGTVGGQGTIAGDLTATEMLAPGDEGVGTLSVTGDLTVADGLNYDWELGASDNDKVAVSGALTLPGEVDEEWTLTLFDSGAPLGEPDALVVFTYGTLADASLGNYVIDTDNVEHWIFPAGATLENDSGNNRVLLTGLSEIVELQWKTDGDGLWTDPGNWFGAKVPDAQNATANFLDIPQAATTITVDSDVTAGKMAFDNANGYTIAGPGEITLDASSGEAQINVLANNPGSHRIEAPLSLAGNLVVDAGEATTLTIDPDSMNLLVGDLTKNGLGALVLTETSPLAGDVTVNEGVLEVGENVLALGSGSNTIYLGEGSTLKAVGVVNHRVVNTGTPGTSTVEAVGTMDVGVTTLANGYDYQGALEVGPHLVGLRDATDAELYGAHMAGGTISSFNGIRLLPINISDGLNSRLYGYGTVNGNVVAGIEGNPTPAVVVADPGQTIELTGVVQTGNSTFVNNVVITGTERLGFSPAVGMKLGGAPIGPDAVVEVYGTAGADFESEIPDALAPPVADPVSGYGQFYVAGGESLVSGKITLSTGGSDYVGRGGDTFELIVTGQAWLMDFTQFPPQNVLLPEGSVNIDPGFIVDTSGIPLASPGLFWQEFRSDQGLTLKIVPEPGTLVLLLTGGLGLLLLVWRRSRGR